MQEQQQEEAERGRQAQAQEQEPEQEQHLQRLPHHGTARQAAGGLLPPALLRQACAFEEGALLVDVQQEEWPILFANPAWAALTGVGVQQATSSCFWELYKAWGGQSSEPAVGSGGGGSGTNSSGGGNGRGRITPGSSSNDTSGAALRSTVQDAVADGIPMSIRVLCPLKQRPMRVSLRPAAVSEAAAAAAAPAAVNAALPVSEEKDVPGNHSGVWWIGCLHV